MKKDESIQLTYASIYVQTSKLWTMEKILNAFEIIGCKHNMASDQQLYQQLYITIPIVSTMLRIKTIDIRKRSSHTFKYNSPKCRIVTFICLFLYSAMTT